MNPSFTSAYPLRTARRMFLPALVAAFSLTVGSALAQPSLVVSVDGSVPSGTYNNVTINSGINATLGGPVNVTGTFTVQSTATLSVSDTDFIGGNSFVLQNDGNLRLATVSGIGGTNSGPLRTVIKDLGTKGRFVFNNANQAQFTGSNFPDEVGEFVANNISAGGVTLSRPLAVRERLFLRNGVLHTAGHKLTLISRVPDIAMVTAASCVVFQQSGSVDGPVSAQRYINPRFNAGVGYRHFSSSVNGNTVGDFSSPTNFNAVVNPQYNTVPYAQRFIAGNVLPYPNTFYYDQAAVGTGGPGAYNYVFEQGYLSPTSLNDPTVVTRGYTVRIPSSSIVEFTGVLNNGDITTPPLARGVLPESGWHLVGNPYASKIDWTQLQRSGMFNSFYKNISNGETTGVYDSYVDGVATGTPSANEFIAANQAVFVRTAVVGVPGTITFTNSARITDFRNDPTAPFFRPTATTTSPFPLVRLVLQNTVDSTYLDAVVRFRPGATTGLDVDYDAFFINGGHPVALSSRVGTDNLSINSLPELTSTTDYTVELTTGTRTAGTYTLNATQLLSLPLGFQVLLQDAVTGTIQDLTLNPVYTYTSTGNNANSTRFTVRFRANNVTGTRADVAAAQSLELYPNPLKPSDRLSLLLPGVEAGQLVKAALVNQLGQRVWSATFRSALGGVREEVKTDLARGVYTMQVTLPDGATQSRRVVVQ